MEIPALDEGRQIGVIAPVVMQPAQFEAQIQEAFGDDMNDKAGALQPAPDGDEFARHYHAPVGGEDFGPHDDIDDAGLIFEGDEDDAIGGAGHLAHEDEAGDGYMRILGQRLALVLPAGDDAELLELGPEEAAGMRLER